MSCFLGATAGSFGGMLVPSDERTARPYHQWGFCTLRPIQSFFQDGVLWPTSRGLGYQFGGSISDDAASDSGTFELNPGFDDQGGQQVKKITGLTLDSTGAVLGSCIVQGFVTSNDVFVGQTTSDAGGYYELTTIYLGVNHYVVAYKAGVPDVSGTSVNTLVPA